MKSNVVQGLKLFYSFILLQNRGIESVHPSTEPRRGALDQAKQLVKTLPSVFKQEAQVFTAGWRGFFFFCTSQPLRRRRPREETGRKDNRTRSAKVISRA